MEKTHYIYRITHLPTGRFYIGKRSCNGPWQEDRYMGSGKVMKRLLKKYPAEEFRKEVLCLCRDAAQALYAEKAAIGTQWRDNPLCINLCEGGIGLSGYYDLPENRAANIQRRKAYYAIPENREAHSARRRKYFEDANNRVAISVRAKKHWADPDKRAKGEAAAKKRWEDPTQRVINSESHIKESIPLCKEGVIYEVKKEHICSELSAGGVFTTTNVHIHHLSEGVWFTCHQNTAKHLLLLNVGWAFGSRNLLEKITLKHVDKATGKVLPRS